MEHINDVMETLDIDTHILIPKKCIYAILFCNLDDPNEVFIKVGKTVEINIRISTIHNSVKNEYKTFFLGALILTHKDADEKEKELLNILDKHDPSKRFVGYTECITCSSDNIKEVSNLINRPLSELDLCINDIKKGYPPKWEETKLIHKIREAMYSDLIELSIEEKTKAIKHKLGIDDTSEIISQRVPLYYNGLKISNKLYDVMEDNGSYYTMIHESDMLEDIKENDVKEIEKLGTSLFHFILKKDEISGIYNKEMIYIFKNPAVYTIDNILKRKIVLHGTMH